MSAFACPSSGLLLQVFTHLLPLLTSFPPWAPIKIPPVFHRGFLDFPSLFIIVISFEILWYIALCLHKSNAWYRPSTHSDIDLMSIQPDEALRDEVESSP